MLYFVEGQDGTNSAHLGSRSEGLGSRSEGGGGLKILFCWGR